MFFGCLGFDVGYGGCRHSIRRRQGSYIGTSGLVFLNSFSHLNAETRFARVGCHQRWKSRFFERQFYVLSIKNTKGRPGQKMMFFRQQLHSFGHGTFKMKLWVPILALGSFGLSRPKLLEQSCLWGTWRNTADTIRPGALLRSTFRLCKYGCFQSQEALTESLGICTQNRRIDDQLEANILCKFRFMMMFTESVTWHCWDISAQGRFLNSVA